MGENSHSRHPTINRMPSLDAGVVRAYEESLANRAHYRDQILAAVASRKHVVFYGCGIILDSIVETWRRYVGRQIDFCCDSDPLKWGKQFSGARCLSPDELLRLKNDCIVFVTIGNFQPVVDQLRALGFPAVSLLFKYDLVNSDFLDTQEVSFIAANLCHARSLFADTKSLAVFDAICRRVLDGGRNYRLMADQCEGDQYFPADIVRLTHHEHFVDLGAFDGDTVADFIRRTSGQFDCIDAFELDSRNFQQLQARASQLPRAERIRIHNLGVWDSECEVSYSVGLSNSSVGTGTACGRVIPLDSVLKDDPVSFIKMDIEGAEVRALRGARQIIETRHPTLAVCVYHHFQHLWEIPILVSEMLPAHSLFLRHHNPLEYETVFYAVRP